METDYLTRFLVVFHIWKLSSFPLKGWYHCFQSRLEQLFGGIVVQVSVTLVG